MKAKYLIGAIFETVIKGVLLVFIIIFVYRTAMSAYDFGYRVFAEEPISRSGGRIITINVTEDFTVKGVAEMLAEKGLIRDSDLFVIQELLSKYHDKLRPGYYDLSTAMTAEEMMAVMSAEADGEDGE